jgi:excisionase family DNA binding protein
MTVGYVSFEELAKHLSVKVTTVRDWVAKGHIPKQTYIKVGTTYRFNIPEVVAALKQEASDSTKEKNAPVQLEFNFTDEDDV